MIGIDSQTCGYDKTTPSTSLKMPNSAKSLPNSLQMNISDPYLSKKLVFDNLHTTVKNFSEAGKEILKSNEFKESKLQHFHKHVSYQKTSTARVQRCILLYIMFVFY